MIGPFISCLLSLDSFFLAPSDHCVRLWLLMGHSESAKAFAQPIHFREWILFFSFVYVRLIAESMPLYDLWIFGLCVLSFYVYSVQVHMFDHSRRCCCGSLFISHKSNIVDQATEMNGMYTI